MEDWHKNIFTAPDGLERVYEVMRAEDRPPCGVAVAEILRSQPHCHAKTQESYFLISGKLRIHIDGATVTLDGPGDTIAIPLGSTHWAENDGSQIPAVVLVITLPAWTSEDHILS